MLRRLPAFAFLVGLFGAVACGTSTGDSGPRSSNRTGGAGGSGAGMGAGGAGATASGGGGSSGTGGRGGAGGASGSGAGGASGASGGGATGSGGTIDAGSGSDGSSGGTLDGGAVATCLATATLKPGETNETLQVGGTNRNYILHVPTGYTGTSAVPLVLDFHPILADNTAEIAASGYKALSDKEGFIVAWPNGIDNAWNVGPCCTMSRTVDDEAFARALVKKIEEGGCVDPKRVYATGYSMGGGMSHYLACHAADLFAAVAPAAFDLLGTDADESEEPCHPSRPISEITFRGTQDPIVPYAGGASTPPNGLNVTIHFLGAVKTFQKWARLDQCTDTPKDTGSGCQTYSQCAQGAEVTLCTKQGGGHDPGDSSVSWPMLKKHPMP